LLLLLVLRCLTSLAFCYHYVDPRPLHSFPTRRSSDLPGRHQGVPRPQRGAHLGPQLTPRPHLCGLTSLDPGSPCSVIWNRCPIIDRKSTRLNSSHVKIPYAGFCLKQKTVVCCNLSTRH